MGTLVINITGSFLMGFLMTSADRTLPHGSRLAFASGGRVSGRVHYLFEFRMGNVSRRSAGGALWSGMLNVVSSVLLGYVAVWLGVFLARR